MNELKNWFLQNSPRKQLALSIGALITAVVLLYMVAISPLAKNRDRQLTNNQALVSQLIELRRLAAELLGRLESGGAQPLNLAQLTNQSLRSHNLRMEDFQPTGDTSVRIRLANVEFNSVIAWLDELENKEGVQISEISVTGDAIEGLLSNVTVKLARN
jgi:general secretion pathway protein M